MSQHQQLRTRSATAVDAAVKTKRRSVIALGTNVATHGDRAYDRRVAAIEALATRWFGSTAQSADTHTLANGKVLVYTRTEFTDAHRAQLAALDASACADVRDGRLHIRVYHSGATRSVAERRVTAARRTAVACVVALAVCYGVLAWQIPVKYALL